MAKAKMKVAKARPIEDDGQGAAIKAVPLTRAKPRTPKKLWDNSIVIGEVMKTPRKKFVLTATTKDGYRNLLIREFYKVTMGPYKGQWFPGKYGIMVPLKVFSDFLEASKGNRVEMLTPLEDLLKMMQEAIEVVRTMDLADPENEVWYYPKR